MPQVRISPTTFDNWRKKFMDAGKRDLAGIGGDGRKEPAKALARENESLKIVVGEQALALAELKKSLELRRGRTQPRGGRGPDADGGDRGYNPPSQK